MSRKSHPVSQVLKLIEGLDDNERAIVRDFLRAPRRSKSSSPAPAAGRQSRRRQSTPSPEASTKTEPDAAGDAPKAAAVGGD